MSFKRIDPEDFVVSSDPVTSVMWSTGTPTLTDFYTSSIQEVSPSGQFYLSVYHTASTLNESEVQFDIAYCDKLGSGSLLYNIIVEGKSPSRTNYGQYRTLILEDENSDFRTGQGTIGTSTDSCGNSITSSNAVIMDHFWAISLERARYKESILPGTLNISLSGSGGLIQLTDNSNDVSVNSFLGTSRVFQLISGSNGSGIAGTWGYTPNSGSYGLVFPDMGLILLNPLAISESINVSPSRSYNDLGLNERVLYNALVLGGNFQANSQETITSNYVFIRARNSEFNYTENPSFISGSTGELIYDNFINNPITYISTVGMYNDGNELLAVSKISRPLPKNFTKEALIRVKLDF
jgi:hypothetical protein